MEDINIYDNINSSDVNSVEIDSSTIDENTSVELDPAELDVNSSVEIETNYVPTDSEKSWYILPMILSNKKLFNKDFIENIESVDMTDNFLIKVTYKSRPYEFDKEECYHSDYNSEDGYVVVYKAPIDKEYICRMVAKSGHKVLTKDMLMTYFVNA